MIKFINDRTRIIKEKRTITITKKKRRKDKDIMNLNLKFNYTIVPSRTKIRYIYDIIEMKKTGIIPRPERISRRAKQKREFTRKSRGKVEKIRVERNPKVYEYPSGITF